MTFVPMHTILKPDKVGNASLTYEEVSEQMAQFSQLRAVVTQGREHPVQPGTYVRLEVNGTLMMTDMQMEQNSNLDVVWKAKGDVLIAGLGLGMILVPILAKPQVRTVTVIEKYQDVINLVALPIMSLPGAEKLKIVRADIFDWAPPQGQKWDTIYFDIWPNICEDNLPEMSRLHKKFAHRKKPGAWMQSWKRRWLLARSQMRGK